MRNLLGSFLSYILFWVFICLFAPLLFYVIPSSIDPVLRIIMIVVGAVVLASLMALPIHKKLVGKQSDDKVLVKSSNERRKNMGFLMIFFGVGYFIAIAIPAINSNDYAIVFAILFSVLATIILNLYRNKKNSSNRHQ